MYRNQSGYSDPTAGLAIGRVVGMERRKRRKRSAAKHRKKIYVASKYAGNVTENVERAIRCCRYVIDRGFMPIASHLLYPPILNDAIPRERELGIKFGLALLALCSEIWVFTDRGKISFGMEREMKEARRLGIPVKHIEMVGANAAHPAPAPTLGHPCLLEVN